MEKQLSTLVRMAKLHAEQQAVVVAEKRLVLERQKQAISVAEQNLRNEYASVTAESQLDSGTDFAAYFAAAKQRIISSRKQSHDAEREVEQQHQRLIQLYAKQRSYELLLERARLRTAAEQAKQEQHVKDEAATTKAAQGQTGRSV